MITKAYWDVAGAEAAFPTIQSNRKAYSLPP